MLSDVILTTPGLLDDARGDNTRDEAAFMLSAMFGSRLVWMHEQGVGYLSVEEAPYDADYFAKYEGYAATAQGRAITRARVDIVERWLARGTVTCDVGIGCGDFIEQLVERGYETYGADVNPAGVEWLRARNILMDPLAQMIDALTFWDALEHIPNVAQLLANVTGFVFCSLPIVPGDGPPSLTWKHLRRDEHCWYFTRKGFIGWMRAQGFECVECNATETLHGREDIENFAFRRIA